LEEKRLSKTSKILLIVVFVLILALVGVAIYFIANNLDNKNKFVAVKEMYDEDLGNYEQRIEVEFKNKKMSVQLMMVFENEDYTNVANMLFKYIGLDVEVEGKKLIMKDPVSATVMMSGGLMTEAQVEELFEKEYSKEEMEEAIEILKNDLTAGGYTIK